MNQAIPSAADIAQRLAPMKYPQLQRLADLSGVPFHTLLKIRSGETRTPGVETVRSVLPHLSDAVQSEAA